MTMGRPEPFRQALIEVRRRLRDGVLEPGGRVTPKEVADDLRLSATPVREALSRLAGEGLLEDRRGDGFFVPELSAADIAVLYRLSEQMLLMAQGATRTSRHEARPFEWEATEDPVRLVERLFLHWVGESASRVIIDAHRTTSVRLAPVRRREAALLDDLLQEAQALVALAGAGERRQRHAALHAFHRRRVALAEALAGLLQTTRDEGL